MSEETSVVSSEIGEQELSLENLVIRGTEKTPNNRSNLHKSEQVLYSSHSQSCILKAHISLLG